MLTDEAKELYKDAIVDLVKSFDKIRNANIIIKTIECVVFEITNITEQELQEFDAYGEVNVRPEYNGFTTITQVEVIIP